MGEDGVVGVVVGLPGLGLCEPRTRSTSDYDDRDEASSSAASSGTSAMRPPRREAVLKLEPDFILIGSSGIMITNPEPIFRAALRCRRSRRSPRICKEAGIPSQIHCCGPEYDLVSICAEETRPDAASTRWRSRRWATATWREVKREFGSKLSLMGNLHTTEVMLAARRRTCERAAKQAIDDAAEGGGFILSTGDQCGRDTPDENIFQAGRGGADVRSVLTASPAPPPSRCPSPARGTSCRTTRAS